MSADRVIASAGTPEAAWQAWPPLHAVAVLPFDTLVPLDARVVVVAPHPDDEVLACGGLLAMRAARTVDSLVIAVTDGDASHPRSASWPPAWLALRRRAEGREGLRRLGMQQVERSRVCLGFADGQVGERRAELAERLRPLLAPGDVVFSPWECDGHPDHEATADAVRSVCAALGCRHLQLPIWMWHWAVPGDPRVPWPRLRRWTLSEEARWRKLRALEAHASQCEMQDGGQPPVLTWAMRQRWLRRCEYLLLPTEEVAE